MTHAPAKSLLAAALAAACSNAVGLDAELAAAGFRLTSAEPLRLAAPAQPLAAGTGQTLRAEGERAIVQITLTAAADEAAASRRIADEQVQLRALYQPTLPPYPEFLTRQTGCPERFTPVLESRGELRYLTAYAGPRQTLGACTEEQAAYRVAVAHRYCAKSSKLARLEVFLPAAAEPGELGRYVEGLQCN